MNFFVALLALTIFGSVYNESISLDDPENAGYNGPFAGLLGAFTGEHNDGEKAGRFIFSLFANRNKSCAFSNSYGFGNATCTLYCLISGHQQGGLCASDGYCTCYA